LVGNSGTGRRNLGCEKSMEKVLAEPCVSSWKNIIKMILLGVLLNKRIVPKLENGGGIWIQIIGI
jgi:hypothetical protein